MNSQLVERYIEQHYVGGHNNRQSAIVVHNLRHFANWLDSRAEKAPTGLHCTDCLLLYADPGYADFVVADDVWRRIAPEGGVLCATCMFRRMSVAGIDNCEGRFTSGPCAQHDWKKPVSVSSENHSNCGCGALLWFANERAQGKCARCIAKDLDARARTAAQGVIDAAPAAIAALSASIKRSEHYLRPWYSKLWEFIRGRVS